MRRLLVIFLAMFVGLPAVAPLLVLTTGSDPTLPACCRRDGKHHCMAGMSEASAPSSRPDHAHAMTVTDRCPYGSKALPGRAQAPGAVPTGAAIFAGVVSHPSISPQTESRRRISADRSRQKRGPPAAALA